MATTGFWERDLTREEEERLIEDAASLVAKRGLETPAIFLLEMHKPVMNVAAHLAVGTAPFLVPFLGFERIDDYSRLARNRDAVERLIQRIEEKREAAR